MGNVTRRSTNQPRLLMRIVGCLIGSCVILMTSLIFWSEMVNYEVNGKSVIILLGLALIEAGMVLTSLGFVDRVEFSFKDFRFQLKFNSR
jgi:hypothetical protein